MPWHIDQEILNRLDQIIANTGGVAPAGKKRIRYYNTATIVTANGFLQVADTADTTFFNNGTSTAIVLGIPLAPQTGIAFPCNENEQDVTKYTYTFSGAGSNELFIFQKLYTQPL